MICKYLKYFSAFFGNFLAINRGKWSTNTFSSNCWFWPHTTRREDVVDGDEVGRLHHHRHNQEVQEVGAVRQVSWTLADHEKEKNQEFGVWK